MPGELEMDRSEALRVLGLPISAQGHDIRKAYKRLARIHHPDRMLRRAEKGGSSPRHDSRGADAQKNIASKSTSNNGNGGFHKIQVAFETLQCGIGQEPATLQREHSLFKIGNDGQSISSVAADASTVAQNMGLGDEESCVASVTFTVCPLCLRPCQVGRPLRAHLQSKKHKLDANSKPLSLERALDLATSWFTVEAESKFIPGVGAASVSVGTKGFPLLLDSCLISRIDPGDLRGGVEESTKMHNLARTSSDKGGDEFNSKRTEPSSDASGHIDTASQRDSKSRMPSSADVYRILKLEKARASACAKASASAAAASVRASEGAGDRNQTKLSRGFEACRDGDLDTVCKMLQSGELDPVNDRGKYDSTAIHWAAGSGHLESVFCLLSWPGTDLGARTIIEQRDKRSGRTAIHWAARNGHASLLEALAERYQYVDLDVPTFDGTTPFQLAAWAGHKDVCRMLLRRKACDPNHVNMYGCNALHFACIAGRGDMCKWLYGDECQVNAWVVQRQGHTALHKAAWAGSHEICAWLQNDVGLDTKCEIEDVKGHTASDIARIGGHLKLAQELVSRG